VQGTLGNPVKCSSQCKQFLSYNHLLDVLETINYIPLEHLDNILTDT